MKQLNFSIVAMAFALVSSACAQGEPIPPNALDWISGHWRSAEGTSVSEEIWTDGEGGAYFAVNRSIKDGKVIAFEFLRIESNGGLVFIAQPQGVPPTRFDAIQTGENQIVFYNKDNEFPKFVEYARAGDALSARIWNANDKSDAMSFAWTLVSD